MPRYPVPMMRPLDFDSLQQLRHSHPAWTLLRAENAPMIIGFLQRTFIVPNLHSIAEKSLAAQLDGWLRQRLSDACRATE